MKEWLTPSANFKLFIISYVLFQLITDLLWEGIGPVWIPQVVQLKPAEQN